MYKRFALITLITLLVLVPVAIIAAQEGSNATSYSELTGDVVVGGPSAPVYGPSSAALTFYNNRTTFDTAWPGLPLEDFEASLVPALGICSDFGTISENTNDACFTSGSILPGIVISPSGDDYVVLGDGFAGNPTTVVGPNTFLDDGIMDFNPPVAAVGLDLLDPLAVISVDIFVYGPGNVLLGNTTVAGVGATPVFWGVSSDNELISRIVLQGLGSGEDLYDNVAFGGEVVVVEPSLVMTKTVGLVANACAPTDEISIPAGFGGVDVYYCYKMENTGDITLTYHTVTDTELGLLLGPDFVANVAPGGVVWFTATTLLSSPLPTATWINTATWVVRNDQGGAIIASDFDTATVTRSMPTGVALADFGAELTTSLAPLWLAALLAVIVGFGLALRRKMAN